MVWPCTAGPLAVAGVGHISSAASPSAAGGLVRLQHVGGRPAFIPTPLDNMRRYILGLWFAIDNSPRPHDVGHLRAGLRLSGRVQAFIAVLERCGRGRRRSRPPAEDGRLRGRGAAPVTTRSDMPVSLRLYGRSDFTAWQDALVNTLEQAEDNVKCRQWRADGSGENSDRSGKSAYRGGMWRLEGRPGTASCAGGSPTAHHVSQRAMHGLVACSVRANRHNLVRVCRCN